MELSVVIPNYNGEKLLAENIPVIVQAIHHYSQHGVELIIVDDYSTDSSVTVIKKLFANYKTQNITFVLLTNSQNLGFSKTVNKGVAHAKGAIIVLLNSDIKPEKGFLNPLMVHFSTENVFAVGCMDRSVEEKGNIVLRGRGVARWTRGFLVHSRGEVNKTNTLWVSGGSGAFKKSIWDKLGGLDPLFSPFYWEDIDLSYRAIKSGYKILFEPKSIVVHEHENGSIKTSQKAEMIQLISLRNQLLFVWKNITDKNLLISHLLWLPYYFIKALFDRNLSFYYSFFKAIGLWKTMRKSSIIAKKQYVLSDKVVISTACE